MVSAEYSRRSRSSSGLHPPGPPSTSFCSVTASSPWHRPTVSWVRSSSSAAGSRAFVGSNASADDSPRVRANDAPAATAAGRDAPSACSNATSAKYRARTEASSAAVDAMPRRSSATRARQCASSVTRRVSNVCRRTASYATTSRSAGSRADHGLWASNAVGGAGGGRAAAARAATAWTVRRCGGPVSGRVWLAVVLPSRRPRARGDGSVGGAGGVGGASGGASGAASESMVRVCVCE